MLSAAAILNLSSAEDYRAAAESMAHHEWPPTT
jgi:hypothetical protein